MDRADDLNGGDRFFIEQDVFDLRLNDPKTGKGIFGDHPYYAPDSKGGTVFNGLPKHLEKWAIAVMQSLLRSRHLVYQSSQNYLYKVLDESDTIYRF